MYHSIRPGQVWLDTEGKRIQAHGGSVIYIDGTYYFYGENKEKTDGKNGIWHWGVRCYASKDLYNWEDKGLIIRRIRSPHCIRLPRWTGRISFIIGKRRNMWPG